ncbi:MAG: SDR family NAD(P)-dependent oxidoreductase [Candidatus Omnitrophica bacterium]|nr:SDR family NAD(P)-dependent oxidoreductase [Candidatus Omnitrophota bacterium]MCM8828778.1 SDR family NAD(P)-dependent oxidoreductase [Candidatus Omnitrophota bacterium]
MKKILITGGAGFIGSHLCDGLITKDYKVTVFDNLDPQVHPERKMPDCINNKVKFIKGDVRDYDALKDAVLTNDCIFHFAAAVGVGQSQYKISKYVDININGTANLLDILANARHKIKKLIVAASMSSYGEGPVRCDKCGIFKPELRRLKEGRVLRRHSYWEIKCPRCGKISFPVPAGEETVLDANSIYAITKKVQEETCMLIGKTYGIPVVSLRFFNVYGPRQSLSNPYTGVTAIFISRIKNNNPPVIFEDGLQTRDFVWVGDVVRACILALESEKADYEIFNVGAGKPVSILEIARILIKLSGKNIIPSITYKFRKGDVRHCFADIRKIKRLLGFKPEISLTDGLSKLVDWSTEADARDHFDSALKELQDKSLV